MLNVRDLYDDGAAILCLLKAISCPQISRRETQAVRIRTKKETVQKVTGYRCGKANRVSANASFKKI